MPKLGGLILDNIRADALVELFDRADAVFGEDPHEDGEADHHRQVEDELDAVAEKDAPAPAEEDDDTAPVTITFSGEML